MSYRIAFIGAALLLVVILLGSVVLYGNMSCCETPDVEEQTLLASADRGDLKAIRELYKRAASDGVEPMAEHWALTGALIGDSEMRRIYVEKFRSGIDPNRQEKILIALAQKSDMPGARCLLAQLNNVTPIPTDCK